MTFNYTLRASAVCVLRQWRGAVGFAEESRVFLRSAILQDALTPDGQPEVARRCDLRLLVATLWVGGKT